MKFKGTAALAVVFIGIVLYYFLIDLPSEKREKEEKNRLEKVILFDSENVKAITFIKEENSVELKRLGADEWQVTAPVNAKGDSPAISDFLSFLNNLTFTRVVEESPKNFSTFGLDTPNLKVILSMNDGKTKGIRVGENHPMGNKVYLAQLNGERVLTADITRDRLDQKVYDLRDKTILDFKTPQINKIELIRDKKTLTLKKNEHSWQLIEEETIAKGNESEITNLLNTIQAAHIEQFVEEQPEQLASYGLNNSKLTVKLTTLKANEPLTLFIGEKSEHGFYAKTLSKKNIFVINQSLFDALNNRQFVDFLNKSLVEFNDDDLSKVTLRMGDSRVDLIRERSKFGKIEKDLNTLIANLVKKHIPKDKEIQQTKYFGKDSGTVFDIWGNMKKHLKGDGKKLRLVIKDYFDGVEKIIKKNKEVMGDIFYGYTKSKRMTDNSWDEQIVNNIDIYKIHVIKPHPSSDVWGPDEIKQHITDVHKWPMKVWDVAIDLEIYTREVVNAEREMMAR